MTKKPEEHMHRLCEARYREILKLRDALKRLWLACPTGLECRSFHHHKSEQHSYLEPCGPAEEYLAAIAQAQEMLT